MVAQQFLVLLVLVRVQILLQIKYMKTKICKKLLKCYTIEGLEGKAIPILSDTFLKKIAEVCQAVSRNVIEDVHSEGKITNIQMAEINKQTRDAIYTILHSMFSEYGDGSETFAKLLMLQPNKYENPKLTTI